LQQAVRQHHPQAWRLLQTIPGIGPRLAALFLALTGPLDRFPDRKALIAYAGLDVTLHQSGRFAGRCRLSKRGDPLLRHVLYLIAAALKRYTRRFARLSPTTAIRGEPSAKPWSS
jgi:transposase